MANQILGRGILRKATNLIRVVKAIKNWDVFLLHYLGLLKKETTTYTLRSGIRIEVKAQPPVGDIFVHKVYNPKGFEIRNGYIVIDIGAHRGLFSLYAANSAKGVTVYSYEPDPGNFQALKRNIALNQMEKWVTAFNVGVAGGRGKRLLSLDKFDAGHTLYGGAVNMEKVAEIEIDCVTLGDIFEANSIDHCDFLKIDCEGAEYEILLNSPEGVLKWVRKISLEYHPLPGFGAKDLMEFLKETGFEVKVCPSPRWQGLGYLWARNVRFEDHR